MAEKKKGILARALKGDFGSLADKTKKRREQIRKKKAGQTKAGLNKSNKPTKTTTTTSNSGGARKGDGSILRVNTPKPASKPTKTPTTKGATVGTKKRDYKKEMGETASGKGFGKFTNAKKPGKIKSPKVGFTGKKGEHSKGVQKSSDDKRQKDKDMADAKAYQRKKHGATDKPTKTSKPSYEDRFKGKGPDKEGRKAERKFKRSKRKEARVAGRKERGGSKVGQALKKIGKGAAKVGKTLARVGAAAGGHYVPKMSYDKKKK
ncbi:MAG: hypothetical protein ACR2M7_04290 [Bdellovibrionales bacterium]